jgi:zinc transport system ATP-binding protein
MSIKCQNVSFGYDGQIKVRNLDFTIEAGNFLLLVGENGSGKSTLIKGLLRLLPPMEGTLSFTAEFEHTYIGYLSQQIAPKQDFPAGVFEIIMSGNLGRMKLRPFYTRLDKQKVLENMRLLGITDLKNRCFRELSGGQQRRVLLARSLCAADKLLVLDEPFAGLDPLISTELYQLLAEINQKTGLTIIMASHDVEAINYVSHVLHLQKRQRFFGIMEEYKQSETGRKFFVKMETGDV